MDAVLSNIALCCRLQDIAFDAEQILHQFSSNGITLNTTEIQHAAKSLGLKCKIITITETQWTTKLLLPAILVLHSNESLVLVKSESVKDTLTGKDSTRFLSQHPNKNQPDIYNEEQLNALNPKQLIILQPGLKESIARQFDIRWFIPILKKYKSLFKEVIIVSFFIQLFALVTPFFFQVVMDKVLVHRGFTTLDVLAVGFLAVAIFEVILSGIRKYLLMHTTNRIDVELGSKLYRHLMALPISFFASRKVGHTVTRVRELDTIREFITGSSLTLLLDLAFTLVFFAVLYYYSPLLTAVVAASLPVYIFLSLFITPILRHRLNQKFKYGAENQAFLTESVNGIETVKSLSVEPKMQRKWEDQLAKHVTASFRAGHLSNISNQIAALTNKVVTLLIIWIGAHLVIEGKLTVGQLIAFNMIAARVSGPILKLVQLWQDFQQVSISVKRLGDILNTPQEPGYDPTRSTLPKLHGKVEFDQVAFRYHPDAQDVLQQFQLSVKPGESIGIVGRSGSGKSTVARLIQRLYVPNQGRVRIDGVDLSMVDTSWLRRHIGVVLQNNMLFSGSIRENIALAAPSANMHEIVQVSQLAGAHEFIVEMPQGYDSTVEEQGGNLSGGQKQRIAIARALLTKPNILIFDEATSALDYESERIIQDNMQQISKGRTTFIIAHRLSTVRHCDRIVVLDKGRIVEQGSHDHLIQSNGYYAKLNQQQIGSNPSPVRVIRRKPKTPIKLEHNE
ncbi:MAG: type I secretion system permease/ATPase [Spongiibacteraceae bacterium]|nr:type I secretion system permease/ATPase [Spongiibacteraceae bacterium]